MAQSGCRILSSNVCVCLPTERRKISKVAFRTSQDLMFRFPLISSKSCPQTLFLFLTFHQTYGVLFYPKARLPLSGMLHSHTVQDWLRPSCRSKLRSGQCSFPSDANECAPAPPLLISFLVLITHCPYMFSYIHPIFLTRM